MKSIILLVFIFHSSIIRGQNDTLIAGNWKLVSIESDGIYYNFKKDSISLSHENKLNNSDSADIKELGDRMKSIYSAIRFHFDKDNVFKQSMMGITIDEGSYRTIASKNIVEITTKNSLNKDVIDKAKYYFEQGLLHLSMKWEDQLFNLVLEKD